MPVQPAEIALRRELAETRVDAVRAAAPGSTERPPGRSSDVGTQDWEVVVDTQPGAERHLLTCRATRDNPAPRHEVQAIARLAQ